MQKVYAKYTAVILEMSEEDLKFTVVCLNITGIPKYTGVITGPIRNIQV